MKQTVIKTYDIFRATVVLIQGFYFQFLVTEVLFQVTCQDFPVGVSPAVNRLFHVTHHQVKVPGSQGVIQEGPEILILEQGSILELIQHDMLEAAPGSFINKRNLAPPDNAFQEAARIGN